MSNVASEESEPVETVEEAAIWAVNLFDQANTGGVIKELGTRGQEIANAIDDLRFALNQNGHETVIPPSAQIETEETVEEAAISVVDYFDQANSSGVIERRDTRCKEAARAVDDLRYALNQNGQKTVFSNDEINRIRLEWYRL